MLTYTTRMVLDIEVTDNAGYPTGVTVPVTVEFLQEFDEDYGEDADGRRGTPRVSYELVDLAIDHEILRGLTSAEADQVLSEARVIFEERTKKGRMY